MNKSCDSLFSDILFGVQKQFAPVQASGAGLGVSFDAEPNNDDRGTEYLLSSLSQFDFCTWATMECYKVFNERFYLLTAQNMRIALELHVASVMCRLGIHNNFTVMGSGVVVADCAGKLLMNISLNGSKKEIIRNMYKSTSVGFDNARELVDIWRTCYQDFSPALGNLDASQLMVQVSLFLRDL